MADQADVENALAAVLASAVYPKGTAAPSVIGNLCRVYRGFPAAPGLNADLASGVVNVSVGADAGPVKNVTRYPRRWISVAPVAAVLIAVVSAQVVTFSGTCAVGQLAGVLVDGMAFPYAVQANDSPATVASNLAALLREAGFLVEYAGVSIGLPGATSVMARAVRGAGALQEIRRQEQFFKITLWCPDPVTRDEAAPVIDAALAVINFLPLADGSFARILFVGTAVEDISADASLYRRDLTYSAEYPTTLAQMTPAMLFGSTAVTANAVFLENLQS
jgi:hypothetical protein